MSSSNIILIYFKESLTHVNLISIILLEDLGNREGQKGGEKIFCRN